MKNKFPYRFRLHSALVLVIILLTSFIIPDENDDLRGPKPLGNFDAVTIPIKRAGRLIIVEARIDSLIGNFIFDTGAQNFVLNSTYFRDSQKVYGASSSGVTGNSGQLYKKKIDRFELGNIYYSNLTASMANLGHIENKRQIKILGLIGVNILKQLEIEINLNKNYIRLYRTDKDGVRAIGNQTKEKADLITKLKVVNNVFVIKAKIKDKKLSFCLDTGAETNLLDNHSGDEVLNSVELVRRSVLRGVSGETREVLIGNMKDFSIENKSMGQMQTMIVNLKSMSEAYGFPVKGMLGFDFFKQGVVTLNAKSKEMRIKFYEEDRK